MKFWISDFSTFKTELQNSLLNNINDDSDNNGKIKKIKNSGGNIWKHGNFLDGNFLGGSLGSLMGGNFPGGNFPSGSFPDTV